ncbi:hypothetical protein ASC80_05810 [Afipia sp. Root123D2]|uniref:hypothetical protein n=1 Tax=Afipia sp. Root123D2 TaxID=1736436 RepID=UPI000700435C|nr:hypothetical protein [Afipia sp. Root123D2]KQW22855.1 hypothetical protein ASC80_05810 [Afipia sp. Root123D2]
MEEPAALVVVLGETVRAAPTGGGLVVRAGFKIALVAFPIARCVGKIGFEVGIGVEGIEKVD